MRLVLCVALVLCFGFLAWSKDSEKEPTAFRTVEAFDVDVCVAEGRLRLVATTCRFPNAVFKLTLPESKGLPHGSKIVSTFWSDTHYCMVLVVAHPSFLKTSPANPLPMLTVVKVVE